MAAPEGLDGQARRPEEAAVEEALTPSPESWKQNQMRFLAHILCGFAVSLAAASPPAPGWKKPEPVTGKPVRLTWTEETSRPAYAVWLQSSPLPKIKRIGKKQESATIDRRGLGSLPTQLLVIPKDRTRRPEAVAVDANARKAAFKASRIPDDEIWLWGVTPESPCSMGAGESSLGASIRMLDNKSRYHGFGGAFLWKIKAARPEAKVTAFYIDDALGALKSTEIPGISKAGETWQWNCDRHHGGVCKFVFETAADDWGKSYRVLFKAGKPPHGCPV